MILKKYKVETYTFREFLNKNEIEEVEKGIIKIKSNKKKYMLLLVLIALTVDLSAIDVSALNPGIEAIDKAGNEIIGLIRKVAYWVAIILCSKDVLKHCMRGHMDSVGSIVAMYCLSFGVLYFLPWIFDLIKNIFS